MQVVKNNKIQEKYYILEINCILYLHAFTCPRCKDFASAKLRAISLKHRRRESIMLAWVQRTRYKYGSRQMQTETVAGLRLFLLLVTLHVIFFVLVPCLLTTRFYIALVPLSCFSCLSPNDAFLHYTCFLSSLSFCWHNCLFNLYEIIYLFKCPSNGIYLMKSGIIIISSLARAWK